MEMNFIYRMGHMWLTAFIQRSIYYFAWSMTDCVCVASGLGFNGYDTNGEPKWDMLMNFDVKKIEVKIYEQNAIRKFFFNQFLKSSLRQV
jgi:hypothetical protein